MAKSKQKTVNLFKQIAEATGGVDKDETSPYFIDTGNFGLNFSCAGRYFKNAGIPGSKITEIFGNPGSSKSLLGNILLGSTQRMGGVSCVLDIEKSFNFDFAEKVGHVNIDELLVYDNLVTYEQVERKITNVTRAIRKIFDDDRPIFFVLDSIGVLQTEREHKELELAEDASEADQKKIGYERPGEKARAASTLLRKINPFLKENNATLFIINQVRQKIGVMFGDTSTPHGGGMSLPFFASMRIKSSTKKQILDAELLKSKIKVPIGVNLQFDNKKNRSNKPFLSVSNVQLLFEYGINPLSGLLSVLIGDKRIAGKGGNFTVLEPYANGREIKFKASLERNDIPLDVLLNCPALIDANNAEEIMEYLKPYMKVIEITNSDKITEINVKNEDSDVDLNEFLEQEENAE